MTSADGYQDLVRRVQRTRRLRVAAKTESIVLPVTELNPIVRIAHRRFGPLNVPKRIILDHEIVSVVSGQGVLEIAGERIDFAKGDVLFIRPFVPHRFTESGASDGEHVAVHFDLAPSVPAFSDELEHRRPYSVTLTHGLDFPTRVRITQTHRVATALTDLLNEWSSSSTDPLSRIAVSQSLCGVLIALLRHNRGAAGVSPSISSASRARIALVDEFLKLHIADKITPALLAQAAGVSAGRLGTVFRQMWGMSPLEYVRHMRVEQARRLLEDPLLSVKEIAARTGFEDVYHFSKVFRKIDGLSPTHYREALLAGRSSKPRTVAADNE